jgi:hypothetical protein
VVAQVAQQLHFHVLDLAMMAAQMTADTLLVDVTHPGPDFTLQVRLYCLVPPELGLHAQGSHR